MVITRQSFHNGVLQDIMSEVFVSDNSWVQRKCFRDSSGFEKYKSGHGCNLNLIQKRNGERTLPPPPSQVVPAVISNVTSVRLRYLPRGDVCDTPHKDCTLAT